MIQHGVPVVPWRSDQPLDLPVAALAKREEELFVPGFDESVEAAYEEIMAAGGGIPGLVHAVNELGTRRLVTHDDMLEIPALDLRQSPALPYRLLWTWDHSTNWYLEQVGLQEIGALNYYSKPADGFLEDYRRLVDFMSLHRIGGVTIYGFLRDNHGGVEAAQELCRYAAERGVRILPVDSEHNAIHQALRVGPEGSVSRLVLTASGGPFRTWSAERIRSATVEDALAHPTWTMGPKITIDSATMMNKALEIIEASDELRRRLRDNSESFRSQMTAAGFTLAGEGHPIIPVMLGDAALATRMADRLLEEGIYVIGFSFPVVPRGEVVDHPARRQVARHRTAAVHVERPPRRDSDEVVRHQHRGRRQGASFLCLVKAAVQRRQRRPAMGCHHQGDADTALAAPIAGGVRIASACPTAVACTTHRSAHDSIVGCDCDRPGHLGPWGCEGSSPSARSRVGVEVLASSVSRTYGARSAGVVEQVDLVEHLIESIGR